MKKINHDFAQAMRIATNEMRQQMWQADDDRAKLDVVMEYVTKCERYTYKLEQAINKDI